MSLPPYFVRLQLPRMASGRPSQMEGHLAQPSSACLTNLILVHREPFQVSATLPNHAAILRFIPCTALIFRANSCVAYRLVVDRLWWPESSDVISIGTPSTSACLTKV